MKPADLDSMLKLVYELQGLASQLGLELADHHGKLTKPATPAQARTSEFNPWTTGPASDGRERVHTYVGLAVGPHEEVADRNYQRRECTFVYDSLRELWTNEHDVHFAPAAAPYGVDSIIVEGRDIVQKIVARMASPAMLGTGNTCGYLKGALSVHPDQMRQATWKELRSDKELPKHAEPPVGKPLSSMFAEHMRSHGSTATKDMIEFLRTGSISHEAVARAQAALLAPQPAAETLAHTQAQAALYQELAKVDPVPVEDVPAHAPAYCDRCERVTVARRNQFVSLGYQVSHLVELPNEAGYAVPCASCRKP